MIPIILEKQKNIRDLGDTVTLDGRSIKRNKLIRSGRLSELSAADATYLLGICRVRKALTPTVFFAALIFENRQPFL